MFTSESSEKKIIIKKIFLDGHLLVLIKKIYLI
jgi:hypothetical protein